MTSVDIHVQCKGLLLLLILFSCPLPSNYFSHLMVSEPFIYNVQCNMWKLLVFWVLLFSCHTSPISPVYMTVFLLSIQHLILIHSFVHLRNLFFSCTGNNSKTFQFFLFGYRNTESGTYNVSGPTYMQLQSAPSTHLAIPRRQLIVLHVKSFLLFVDKPKLITTVYLGQCKDLAIVCQLKA